MPPNIVDMPVAEAPESIVVKNVQDNNGVYPTPQATVVEETESKCKIICLAMMNLVAHLSIGAVVMVSIAYARTPASATSLHIILCVIGYQLLMAEAMLSLAPHNGWTYRLTLMDKRRAHGILQVLGSVLALAGCFVKICDKSNHWNTLHGQFALVAMAFTSVSLVNGLAAHYSSSLPRWFPKTITKLGHICFGTVAFAAASISLCYGFDKGGFKNWINPTLAYVFMALTALFTLIIILPPLNTFYRKSKSMFS